jgi:hypothetical protein
MKFIEYSEGNWVNLEDVSQIKRILCRDSYQVWIKGRTNSLDSKIEIAPVEYERIKPHLILPEQTQNPRQQPHPDADGWIEQNDWVATMPPYDAEVEIETRGGYQTKGKAGSFIWSIDSQDPADGDIVRFRYVN